MVCLEMIMWACKVYIRRDELVKTVTKKIRQLDKLIDERATGKPMEKVMR